MTIDIAESRAIHERATAGEWIAAPKSRTAGAPIVSAPIGRLVAMVTAHDECTDNARAMAHYHNTYAALLDAAEERDRLRRLYDGACDTVEANAACVSELRKERDRLREACQAYLDRWDACDPVDSLYVENLMRAALAPKECHR